VFLGPNVIELVRQTCATLWKLAILAALLCPLHDLPTERLLRHKSIIGRVLLERESSLRLKQVEELPYSQVLVKQKAFLR